MGPILVCACQSIPICAGPTWLSWGNFTVSIVYPYIESTWCQAEFKTMFVTPWWRLDLQTQVINLSVCIFRKPAFFLTNLFGPYGTHANLCRSMALRVNWVKVISLFWSLTLTTTWLGARRNSKPRLGLSSQDLIANSIY